MKSVQTTDCHWFTASSKADGGRPAMGHHQTTSEREIGR